MQDNIYAHMWWNLAGAEGEEKSIKYRSMIEKNMTNMDISNAQKLARECINKKYKSC